MRIIVAQIKWIMLVSGVLTCTMIYAAIAPGRAKVHGRSRTLRARDAASAG